jgi:hypothetical protein
VISPANEPFSGQKTGYCDRWDSLFACFPAKWGPNFGCQFYEAARLNGNETALPPPELALMCVVQVEEPNGAVSTMDRVIVPKIKAAATCPIPLCQSCQLSSARMGKPKITKSKAIKEVEGAISKDQYEVGDFVSTDRMLYGRLDVWRKDTVAKLTATAIMVELYFVTLHPNISMLKIKSH